MTHELISQAARPDALLWTGRLRIDLRGSGGITGATLDAKLALETVDLWLDERSVAVIDRTVLRLWLIEPDPPLLPVDDLEWCIVDGHVWVIVDRDVAYRTTEDTLRSLLEVI